MVEYIVKDELPGGEDVEVVGYDGLPRVKGCGQNPATCGRRYYLDFGFGEKCGALEVRPIGECCTLQPNCGGVYKKVLANDYQI